MLQQQIPIISIIVSYLHGGGDYDIATSLEDTLHRIFDAGGTGEDVHRIMGADIPLPDKDTEDYISIDHGYFICGQMFMFRR